MESSIKVCSPFRYNLDPFNKHSDEELWDALEKTCLKDAVRFVTFILVRVIPMTSEQRAFTGHIDTITVMMFLCPDLQAS